MAPLESDATADEATPGDAFRLLSQQLELDISFCPREIRGKTTLDIQPENALLREIRLNAKQLRPTNIHIEGQKASFNYSNLHQRLTLYPGTGLEQYHYIKDRIKRHAQDLEDELVVLVPDNVKIRTAKPEEVGLPADAPGTFYALLKLEIDYVLDDFRDAFHFVGVEDGDPRLPHAYTRNSPFPGTASCLFPCIDDGETRCPFQVSVRYPRTMGEALARPSVDAARSQANGDNDSALADADEHVVDLSEEEKATEMQVICSGTLTDDIIDAADSTRKTASFTCDSPVLPQHIGFVIGPFQHVDLSDYRDVADEERLASSAIKVHAFCLPGKEEEVRNSAMMLARALDNFTERFQSYAFGNAYKLAFVDDLECDTTHTASFSICSSRLLFPETVWEPLEHTTRMLVHAVASQWIGVDVVAHDVYDYWVIVGASWFMAELYLLQLFGRNDHRYRQKIMVDKVIKMDKKRPSLERLGQYLQVDTAEQEFMELKSLMVLSILHNRLVKQSGKNGMDRCLFRLLFNARQGKYNNSAITTEDFLEICEKVGHQKLDSFFGQWVRGSGCPHFKCTPSFNKKKQVVALHIKQTQADSSDAMSGGEGSLASDDFMRVAKESAHGFISGNEHPTFVGPMTIRIHEADGTPYEHIVDINSSNVKVEIPYNTKYKRLKRNRLNKERMAATQGLDAGGETQEDVTFYMLGDLFQTPQEQDEWRLSDWPAEDEARMEAEAYEWIRIDADFEWICDTQIIDMPSYMYVSQLQQDKDVVAQYESIQFLASKEGHPLISTFLVKTLMDSRYFHGVRTYAAEIMARSALRRTNWTGLFHLKKVWGELFCLPNSPMTRSNDFSDRALYNIQCAIPRAIARIKDEEGRAPMEAKRFLLDIIRYNDNRGNEYSDDYYISTLMACLADCLTSSGRGDATLDMERDNEEHDFTKKAIEELTRHQRLDEWIPTYQNVYTTTALECARKLMINHVTPFRTSEFLQYTQLGNADNVRLEAWNCLMALGMIRNDSVLRYLLHELQSDPSPYFRRQLLHVVDLGLGQVALGDVYEAYKADTQAAATDSLVVETDGDTSQRKDRLARQTLNGALRGLKVDLQDNAVLRSSMEQALRSKTLSLRDMSDVMDACDMIFNGIKRNTLPIVLRYPRKWKVIHEGRGRLCFRQTNEFRLRAVRSLVQPEQISAQAPHPAIVTKALDTVPVQAAQSPLPALQQKPKLSLKFGGINKQKSAASPPLSSVEPTPAQPATLFSPVHQAASPHAIETKKASPVPQPAALSESRAPAPHVSPPATAAPTPKLSAPPAAAPPKAKPTSVTIPTTVSTPPAISSPIPIPTAGTKLKIKTKLGPATSASPRPSAAPSPRPSAPSTPVPTPIIKAPTPASSSAPKQSKTKKSKIVKLHLDPKKLARAISGEASKKRKLQVNNSDRPAKRQSLEPSGAGGKTGIVKTERTGGENPRLIVRIKVGKANLPLVR